MAAGGTESTEGELRYALLGPLVVTRAEAEIDLGPPKQRAVLALLLLHRGAVVSTDRLVDALWGEHPPPRALASLQAYISNLRRALRDEAGASSPIVRRPPGYVLDVPAGAVDVADFLSAAGEAREAAEAGRWGVALERADAALAVWRGAPLSDMRDETWVQGEARGLDELRRECRETRVTALLAEGRIAPALVAAQELRDEDPLRERATWLTMIALYRAQRAPEALDAFRVHAERLDEELGLEPGEELRELQVSILRQEPALAAWPRPPEWTGAPAVAAPAPTPEPAAPAPEPVPMTALSLDRLVGRSRETRMVDALLGEVRAGAARSLVLTGPAGIGKTRLAEEVVARARAQGGREVWARCPEEDGSPAWWPIRQLVRALGEDADAVLTPPPGVDSDGARFAVYERVADLLRRAATATAPLAVVVDDVQWADHTSALCLSYVVGELRGAPVALVLTQRDGEDATTVAPLHAALARSDGNRHLAVPALGEDGVDALSAQVAGAPLDAEEVARLAERTGGNPLFVAEYARLAPDERAGGTIPLAVRSVVGRRLAGLDPAVLDVLRAAAVIGDVLELDVLAATTRLDLDDLADRLDAAADEHVIVAAADTGGYAFAHGLVREEVLAAMPALRRQRLHARVAAALAESADRDRLSRRAQHLVAALPLADAAEVVAACRAAAREAEERWSSDAAAHWWEEALRAFDLLPPSASGPDERDELLVARVEALARAGRGQTVLDVVDAGLREALREGRPRTAGRLASALLRSSGAWPWVVSGENSGPVLARLAEVRPLVADHPAARVRVHAALAIGSAYHPDPGVADGLSGGALAVAEELGDPDVLADALLGRLLTYSGIWTHTGEALELLDRLHALEHRHAEVTRPIAHSLASMVHMNLGDADRAAEEVRRAIADADRLRLPTARVQLRWMQGELALWTGDFDQAERQFLNAHAVHGQTELYVRGTTEFALAALWWERGTLEGMVFTEPLEPLSWGAAVAAARGDHAEAAANVLAWLDAYSLLTWSSLGHQALLAHVAADIGLTEAAGPLLALLEPARDRIANIGHDAVVGNVALALGRLYRLRGDDARAAELAAEALAGAERAGGHPTVVRCRLLAAQLTPAGAARDAALAAVADTAERLGMASVAAAARAS
jgi:DNA-binding SARP family transcriptional activator